MRVPYHKHAEMVTALHDELLLLAGRLDYISGLYTGLLMQLQTGRTQENDIPND